MKEKKNYMDFYERKSKHVILSEAKNLRFRTRGMFRFFVPLRSTQNDIMRWSYLFGIAILFFSSSLQAQTAQEMAKELETLYRKGAGTTISFSLDGAKNSLTFSNTVSKFRIESPDDLIISDGTTIWHYGKKKKEVVIDKISSKGSSLASAEELLKFSTNYSSILSHKKGIYELQLSPNATISKLMENIGGISLLVFTFTKSHSGVVIKKVSAKTSNKNFTVGNIKIASLGKLNTSLFSFDAPKGTKVIDLRE
jgi:outer membrane lipoprotein-sorting protein